MTQEQRDYTSYLLRLWRSDEEKSVWHASLQSTHDGQRLNFASLESLVSFLETQFGPALAAQETATQIATMNQAVPSSAEIVKGGDANEHQNDDTMG